MRVKFGSNFIFRVPLTYNFFVDFYLNMSGIWFTIYNLCHNDVCSSEKKSVKPFLCFLSVSPCSSWQLKNFYISILKQQKQLMDKIIMISVCPPVMEIYKDYSDSYQFSNTRFKFCFYILVDDGLNVLFQICIFLKEVIYIQVFPFTSMTFSSIKNIYSNGTAM